jgi:AraC-like DNA-binding protein
VRVDVMNPTPPSARGRIDVELAFFVSFGRRMAEAPVSPIELRLRPASPPHVAEYERVFACPVRLGQPADELEFPSSALDVPLLGASPEVHAVLVSAADRHLDERSDRIVVRARAVVEALLPEGPPALSEVARRLAMSGRSLQRRLQEEGTSFLDLVDDTRRALSYRYVESGSLAAAEISFLVGFSHLNSFYRAFRRWTGASPETYRRTRDPGTRSRASSA